MEFLKNIKRTYRIIPHKYKPKLFLFSILSFFNLVIELISLAIFVPLILMILDKKLFLKTEIFSFLFENTLSDNPYLIIGIISSIILFFIIKNWVSIKIINYQSHTAFKISTEISTIFTKSYIFNDFIQFKNQKKAAVIRNTIAVPNEFTSFVLLALNSIFTEFLLLLFIFILSILIHPLITMYLLLITCTCLYFLHKIDKKRIHNINQFIAKNYTENTSNLLNLLDGFFEIKIAKKEAYFLQKFDQSNAVLNKKYASLHAKRMSTPKYTETIIVILISSIFLFSTFLTKSKDIDLIFLSFLAASAIKIIPSINKVSIGFLNFKSHIYTIDLIENYLKNTNNASDEDQYLLPFKSTISLKDIDFSYKKNDNLLKDINLTLKKGEIVGITGDSGSGKSTLLNILTQLITPHSGEIFVDGIKIEATNKQSFLGLISYIPQSPFILDGTIIQNITLSTDNNSEQLLSEIDNYLQLFNLKKYIDKLPDKLHTPIGNNGLSLSGGQKQRIAIIRALLSKPQILILDEATNQLDKTNELKVLEILKKASYKNNTTVIIVSHRFENLIQTCNSVYELIDGHLQHIIQYKDHNS